MKDLMMTLDQYEAEMERINNEHWEHLANEKEKEMKEEQFNELMEEFNDEIEAIAGQPDPHAELTYGEMKKVHEGQVKKRDPFGKRTIRHEETEEEFDKRMCSTPAPKRIIDKAVDNPSHYDFIDTTVEKFIEAGLTHDELMGWFKGNVIKYRLRAGKKNPISTQDIAKADQYQKFYDEYVKRNTP